MGKAPGSGGQLPRGLEGGARPGSCSGSLGGFTEGVGGESFRHHQLLQFPTVSISVTLATRPFWFMPLLPPARRPWGLWACGFTTSALSPALSWLLL